MTIRYGDLQIFRMSFKVLWPSLFFKARKPKLMIVKIMVLSLMNKVISAKSSKLGFKGDTKGTFVRFLKIALPSEEDILKLEKVALRKMRLQFLTIVAESFDGASNMSGIQ